MYVLFQFIVVQSLASTLNPFEQSAPGETGLWRIALNEALQNVELNEAQDLMKRNEKDIKDPTKQIWYYLQWAKLWLKHDRLKSREYCEKGIALAKEQDNRKALALLYIHMHDLQPLADFEQRNALLQMAYEAIDGQNLAHVEFELYKRFAVYFAQLSQPEPNQVYRNKALRLINNISNQQVISAFYMNMSIFQQHFGVLDSSFWFLDKAIALDSIGTLELAKIYLQKSKLFTLRGVNDSAAANINKAYQLFVKADDVKGIAISLQDMINIYLAQGYPGKSLEMLPRLRPYIEDDRTAFFHYSASRVHLELNHFDLARTYVDSMELGMNDQSPFMLQVAHINLKGEILVKAGQKEEGLDLLFKSYELYKERGLTTKAFGALHIFAEYYSRVLIADGFVAPREGDSYANVDLIDLFETITDQELANEKMNYQTFPIFKALAILHKNAGNHEVALDYYLEGQERKDSIDNQERTKLILDYNTQTRELEMAETEAQLRIANAANKADRDKQKSAKFLIGGVAFFLLVILGLIFLQLRRNRAYTAQLEEQKKLIESQRDQLAELDNMKSSFFANISHELRTPLTLILGPLTDIVKVRYKELPSDIANILRMAYRNGGKIRELVNEILDLGKLEAGELKLEYAPVELHSFSKRVLYTFESLAEIKEVQLRFNYSLSHPQSYLTDINKLDKVLSNLLSNAVKFTRRNGSVAMKVKELEGYISFQVIDDGDGIPPEELDRVFDRYYQSPSRKEGAGTGIGLSFAKHLAEAMDGYLSVESELGKGSTFTLLLPLQKSDTEVEPLPDLETEANQEEVVIIPNRLGSDLHILVVEDNAEMQQYIKSTLAPHFDVVLADNGRMAIEQLESRRFDLILSDLMMPEMDGMELLERVKGNAHWKNTPFVMLTAINEDKDKLKAFNVGLDDYLLKPFSTDELLVRINNLIDNYKERTYDANEGDEDQRWLQSVQEMTDQRLLDEDFSVATLADELHMVERQLYRKMKKLTGLTPNKFIQEMRLRKARGYLESGTYKTLKEVSLAVGFDSFQYFSRLYAKRFGKKPTDYFR